MTPPHIWSLEAQGNPQNCCFLLDKKLIWNGNRSRNDTRKKTNKLLGEKTRGLLEISGWYDAKYVVLSPKNDDMVADGRFFAFFFRESLSHLSLALRFPSTSELPQELASDQSLPQKSISSWLV